MNMIKLFPFAQIFKFSVNKRATIQLLTPYRVVLILKIKFCFSWSAQRLLNHYLYLIIFAFLSLRPSLNSQEWKDTLQTNLSVKKRISKVNYNYQGRLKATPGPVLQFFWGPPAKNLGLNNLETNEAYNSTLCAEAQNEGYYATNDNARRRSKPRRSRGEISSASILSESRNHPDCVHWRIYYFMCLGRINAFLCYS